LVVTIQISENGQHSVAEVVEVVEVAVEVVVEVENGPIQVVKKVKLSMIISLSTLYYDQ
jgi:hypothetical protein